MSHYLCKMNNLILFSVIDEKFIIQIAGRKTKCIKKIFSLHAREILKIILKDKNRTLKSVFNLSLFSLYTRLQLTPSCYVSEFTMHALHFKKG